MITYPLPNYNTFISATDATTKLTEIGSGALWVVKSDTEKDQLLAISALLIKATCNIVADTCEFAEAQVMLLHMDLANNGKYLTLKDANQAYKKAKIGSLSVEYNLSSNSSQLPTIVKSMLGGCLKVSDKPVTRGFDVI